MASSKGGRSARRTAKSSGRSKKSSKKSSPGQKPKRSRPAWRRVARPDAIDFRDRFFAPNIAVSPAPELFPKPLLDVKDQKETNACTGFALSTVVEHLLRRAGREKSPSISPFMLYSMARRYDEFPGSVADDGSSLRGALKGWFKYGACAAKLFPDEGMPQPGDPAGDWWLDAVRRPLGAYYRIDPRQITDMHAALNETGILYASASCHRGWEAEVNPKKLQSTPKTIADVWRIPMQGGDTGGHAFAIVGYDKDGLLIQSSWGKKWGSGGFAILTYQDWLSNAIDCWVAQLGVVTNEHEQIASSQTLRATSRNAVQLAQSEVLRNRELSPHILNTANDGLLSNSGDFRTTPDDVMAMVSLHAANARQAWKLGNKPLPVCIFAHGGLNGESVAASSAAKWIPKLYEKKIFPIFLMWETGIVDTVLNVAKEKLRLSPVGGPFASFERLLNRRLEKMLSPVGTPFWSEMKENAELLSTPRGGAAPSAQPGLVQLCAALLSAGGPIELHFVGHSAGAVVGTHLVRNLPPGLTLGSMTFLAPAVRKDEFMKHVKPELGGKVGRFLQYSLTERAEEDDPTCGPYRRSLLYLVSEAFEGGASTPILGLARDFPRATGLKNAELRFAPGNGSGSSTHGAFSKDDETIASVVSFIKS